MRGIFINENKRKMKARNWKEKNEVYLNQLQKFLDIADNIEENSLKHDVITQMLKCDLILTELAEKEFNNYYEMGKKQIVE